MAGPVQKVMIAGNNRLAYIVDVAEAATNHYRTYGGGRKNERSKEAVRYADRNLSAGSCAFSLRQ